MAATAGLPLTAGALDRLRGPERWEQFARLLGRTLHDLHATPLDSIHVQLLPAEGREAWERIYTEARMRLFDYLPPQTRQRFADRFETFLAEPGNWAWTPAIIHGDFSPRNIRYCQHHDGGASLSGIVGWHHIGLGDPAVDLATLLGPDGYGEEFISHFADAYPTLSEEWPRARFYASVRPLRDAIAAPAGQERTSVERLFAQGVL